MKPDLPPEFIQTIHNTFGADGKTWLAALPTLIDEAAARWGLEDIHPVPGLSYNYVAHAIAGPSPATPAVLKLGVPRDELSSEIRALQFYEGNGAVRLLDADTEKGMLLLERLQPGDLLATITDDELATRIAADVIIQLSRPVPENRQGFIRLADWFEGFARLRRRFQGGTGPLPENLVSTVETLAESFLAENKDEALLHGDFHHYNVLKSERGWLAIDPKGVIGPRGYEVGPLLINPVENLFKGSSPLRRTKKRIAILSEQLGMERGRIREWALCHSVLSAWWSVEDHDPGWRGHSLRCAEIFSRA